jgi:hypothetical protein
VAAGMKVFFVWYFREPARVVGKIVAVRIERGDRVEPLSTLRSAPPRS